MKFQCFKKRNLIILFLLLISFSSSLFAIDLVVNGITGTYAAANGTYHLQADTKNGKSYWVHESGNYNIHYVNYTADGVNYYPYWYIDNDYDDANGLYYSSDGTTPASPLLVIGWSYDLSTEGTVTVAEYSTAPEINLMANGISIPSGATTPSYTDYTNFGTAITGGGTATRTFTIQNTGAQALSIGAISFSGSNASDFSITTSPASSVAASGSTTFTVTFNPSAIGNRTATISIGNNDSDENPYTFAISGYGFTAKNLVVSGSTTPSDAIGTYVYAGIKNNFPYWKHSTLDYYLVNYPDATGATRTWALDNNFLTTDGYPFYCFSAANVPTGLTWSTLSFLPTGAGSYSNGAGSLSVTDISVVPEINVKVGSFDVTTGYTGINFYHNTNFGTLNIASGTKTKSFTLENNGTGTLTINGTSPYITLSGTNASEFSVTKAPSNSIAAGSSTSFEITFDPSTVGVKTAVVNISSNDGDEGSYSFNIQGEAITNKSIIVSNVTTPAVANGTYTYQGISNDFEYWKNSSGYYIYNYRLSDVNDPTWYIDADMSVTPSDATTYNFKSLNNGDNASPANISSWSVSSGSTGTPTIVFSEPEINIIGNSHSISSGDNTPSEYDYTDIGWVASGSVTKTFTIQNTGTETLTLTGASPYIVIGGANPTNFSIASAPAASIPAGGSTTFQITCTPSASLGIYSAILSIANNDANENPYNFSIQGGKGTLPTVTSQPVSDIGTITATGNGTITSLGNPNPTDYGICWNTTGSPTIEDNISAKGATSTASSFNAYITGLRPNTTYYVRTYIKNNVGLVYGSEQTITTLLPTITSTTYNENSGILTLTCANISSGDIVNPTKITITGEGGATYSLTTGNVISSSNTAVSITLNATDKAAISFLLNKNGTSSTSGTIYNVAAADDWDANITAGDISDLTGNGIIVSNVAIPTITGATYDAISGTLSVTGTGFLKLNGASNDINVSKFSIKGEGDATYTLTTADVEISSATSFAITLNATDKFALTQIINKNGSVSNSGTAYNLAANEDWAAGMDAMAIVADLTGNGIVASNITAPGAPTIGIVTPENTQASVSFTAPASNGGSAITGYTVVSSPGGHSGSGPSSPITVAGLTNGAAYTFTVMATNAVGTSVASASSNSVIPNMTQTITFSNPGGQSFGTAPQLSATATSGLPVVFSTTTPDVCSITSGGVLTFLKAGTCTILADQAGNTAYTTAPTVSQTFTVNAVVPGAPTIGAVAPGDTQATVSFTAPVQDGGSPITSYAVTANPGNLVTTGVVSPITVTGLTNGTSYTFTVVASNSGGASAASGASGSVTPIGGQTITFANPGTQNFGTNSQLSATSTSGLKVSFSTTTSDVCSITSEGRLTFLKTGTCTVVADQAGNTAYSAAPTVSQTFVVNAVIPGVPTIGTAIAGNAQATVSFITPTFDGGSPITSYMVTASPGGITATGTSSPITVTGLSNGTSYTFSVAATNGVGTTTASATSNVITAFTLPIATTAAASSISSSTAVLNGTVNANGASTVAAFEYGLTPNYGTTIVADQSPVNATSISTVSKIISGLTPNTTYHYRIVGVNAAGTINGLDQAFTTSLNTALDNTMENGFEIYPNPTTDGFTIDVGDQPALVSIYELSGSMLSAQLACGKTYIPVGSLNPGVYVVKANDRRIKLMKK